jgi:hypothetical protein
MPVWDDDLRGERRAAPLDDTALTTTAPGPAMSRDGDPHDAVRAAAQKDAAEIVARARRDIRRVVADARRELLELSAQVQAANIDLPDDALPDAALLEAPPVLADAELETAWQSRPVVDAPRLARSDADVVPDDDVDAVAIPVSSASRPSSGSARTFVALFALAGFIVVAGTAWWLSRDAAPESVGSAATAAASAVAAPVERETAPAEAPAAAAPTRPDVVSVDIEVRRDTWIRATVDNEGDAGRTYAAGEKRHFEGQREVVIRAGDAGGLLVTTDGSASAAFGPDGMSLTRRFTRQQPAVAPPAVAPPVTTGPRPVESALPRPTPATASASGRATAPAPVAPPTAAVSAPSLAAPPPQQTSASGGAGRVDVAASGRQWLDAYHRQDQSAMEPLASPSLAINDERRPDQRFPFGLEVTRAFEDEQLQLAGDSATFTARMTERAPTGSLTSRVTQTWVRRAGVWQLQEARLVHEVTAPGR